MVKLYTLLVLALSEYKIKVVGTAVAASTALAPSLGQTNRILAILPLPVIVKSMPDVAGDLSNVISLPKLSTISMVKNSPYAPMVGKFDAGLFKS